LPATDGRIARVEIFETMTAAEPHWRLLEQGNSLATPYQHYDFLALWHRHVGASEGITPFIAVGFNARGQPLFLWPFGHRKLAGLRVLEFLGGKHANFNMGLWRRDVAAGIEPHVLNDALRQLADRADLLERAADSAAKASHYDLGADLARQAIEIRVSAGDRLAAARATAGLGYVYLTARRDAEGREVLEQALAEYGDLWPDPALAELKTLTDYSVDVIGHTDQTGSERANRRIGLERAQLIADRLIAAGIPADRVHATSMGSKEPAVKRKNRRIIELRNRRVEIWLR